jgi:uncharacterized protein (AIM24 family)
VEPHHEAAQQQQQHEQPDAGVSEVSDDVGTFNGGSFRISHRDSNTILTVQLAPSAPFIGKPGSMIAMSHSVTLKGQFKFSMKKLVVGAADMGSSTFTGPGEVLLAPPMLGDISTIRLDGNQTWSVGHDAYLASTQGVVRDYKRQGLSKAMFSGEGLFVYKMSGVGLLWITSFGAIIKKNVSRNSLRPLDPPLTSCSASCGWMTTFWPEKEKEKEKRLED